MTFEWQRQNLAERRVSNNVMENILNRSFLSARLLTGSTTQAEKAVLEAIDVWNPDNEDGEQLFQITLRTALRARIATAPAVSKDECAADCWLPGELRRVLELSLEIRRCFVLRVLVGLPSQLCAEMLDLDIRELDRICREAMRNLTPSIPQ